MSAYELYCSVCLKSFQGRGNWLKHLIEGEHQKIASLEVCEWDKKMKKCAIVAFASCPMVTCALELLEYFSIGMDIVTDFIFLPEQAHVGILQFEIKDKVNEIVTKLKDDDSQVEINDKQVQFRKAISYMDIEWKLLISKVNSKIQKRKCAFLPETESEVLKKSKMQNTSGTEPGSPLQIQYKGLLDSVQIPDADFTTALNLNGKLKEMFRVRYPHCEMYLFRNWYLQLKNASSDELLIYMDYKGNLKRGDREMETWSCSREDVQNIFALENTNTKQAHRFTALKPKKSFTVRSSNAFYCSYKRLNFNFALIWHPWLLVEIQTCRLLEHLCLFDVRVKPLLALIFFWSRSNRVFLSTKRFTRLFMQFTHNPEPAALEWLVMLFLSHRKMIPTPRKIVEGNNKAAIIVKKKDIDIGFEMDENFVKRWRSSTSFPTPDENSDEFIKNILNLAADFFTLFNELSSDSWILYFRDGEILSMHDVMKKEPFTEWHTNLTLDEVKKIRDYEIFGSGVHQFVLVHPLFITHRLCFNSNHFVRNVCPLMKSTVEKIKLFLAGHTDSDLMALFQGNQ